MHSQVSAGAPLSLLVLQIDIQGVVLGLVGPFVFAAAVLAVAFRPWVPARVALGPGEEIEEEERGWGGALAVGVAFVVGFVATQGWPPLPRILASSTGSSTRRWRERWSGRTRRSPTAPPA